MSKRKKRHKITYPSIKSQQPKPLNPLASDNPAVGIIAQASSYSGPIPPPDLLAKFDGIIPNGADRILKMAEAQSKHRQCIEKWAVIGGTILSHFGVLCAACIALSALYLGYRLIMNGQVIPGAVLGGGGLTGLVAAFIYGTRSRRKEREQRDQQNKELTRQK